MSDFIKEVLVLLGFIIAVAALCIVVRDKKKLNDEMRGSEEGMDDTKPTSDNTNNENKIMKKRAVNE